MSVGVLTRRMRVRVPPATLMWKVRRIVKTGHNYLYALVPEHPSATPFGYVYHHRVVVENHLGRVLDSEEVVHHINGDGRDNRIENLEVLSRSAHSSHHGLEQESHGFVVLTCDSCGVPFERSYNQRPSNKKNKRSFCTRDCYYDALRTGRTPRTSNPR